MKQYILGLLLVISVKAFSQPTNEKAEMLAAVKYLNKWGYINSSGKEIIIPKFDKAEDFSENGYAVVWLKNKAGIIDYNGRMILEPKYDDINIYHNDGFAQIILNEKKGVIELESGNVVIPAIYKDMYHYWEKENLNKGGLAVKLNGKWGIIDKANKTIIHFQYDSIVNLEKEVIPFLKDGNWGYLSPNGLEVIRPIYKEANEFKNRKAIVVTKNDTYDLVDKEKQFGLDYTYIMQRDNGYLIRGRNYKWGLLDKDANEIVAPNYDYIYEFKEGLARFGKDGKVGFLDKEGKEVVKAKYNDASDMNEGSIWTFLDNKYGLLDHGETEIEPTYDYVTSFNNYVAWVYLNKKWGLIGKTGYHYVDFIYDEVGFISEERSAVQKNKKAGYIDLTGHEITPLKYDSAGVFKQGLGIVYLDGKAGFVDRDGAEVIPPRYENASNFYPEGVAWIVTNKKYGLIDRSGQEILPAKYDAGFHFFKGVSFVKSDGKYGIVNDKGKLISPIKYDSIARWKELTKTILKGTFTDNRDGKTYRTLKIGNQWVMAENFAYKPPFGTVWVYDNDMKNLAANGYLYDWSMAKMVVPAGWHIPTKLEWKTLLNSLDLEEDDPADILVQGGTSGFGAMMSGARNNEAKYELKEMGTAFWSATDPMSDKAYIFVLVFDEGKYTCHLDLNYKTFGHSLRLFKD